MAHCHPCPTRSTLILTMLLRTLHLRVTRRGAGKLGGAGFTRRTVACSFGSVRKMWTTCRYTVRGGHKRAQHVHASHFGQPGVGNEEPSLPPLRRAGPCLELCFESPLSITSRRGANHPPWLHSGGRAASSAPWAPVRNNSYPFPVETRTSLNTSTQTTPTSTTCSPKMEYGTRHCAPSAHDGRRH